MRCCNGHQVEKAWERLQQTEQGAEGKRLMRPVIFVKLKGETWVPPRDAVRDRFGQAAVPAPRPPPRVPRARPVSRRGCVRVCDECVLLL